MTTLYEKLGVGPTATPEEIKKAYKRKAHKHHPDREGGDEDQFKEITAAYEVLMDETRRKYYDETGEIKKGVDDTTAMLRDLVALIFSLIDKYDMKYTNLIDAAKEVVRDGIGKQEQSIHALEESIADREDVLKRLTCKKPNNVLAEAIRQDIEGRKRGVIKQQEHIETGKKLLDMLGDYEYKTEAAPQGFQMRRGPVSTTSTVRF